MKGALNTASSVCPAAAAAPSRKRSRVQEISWHSLNPKPQILSAQKTQQDAGDIMAQLRAMNQGDLSSLIGGGGLSGL
jgi:hypothetical protein